MVGERRGRGVLSYSRATKVAEVPCPGQRLALFLAQTELYFARGCGVRNTGPNHTCTDVVAVAVEERWMDSCHQVIVNVAALITGGHQ